MSLTLNLKLHIPVLQDADLECGAFRAEEEVSRPFRVEVFIASLQDHSSKDVIGQPAWLTFSTFDKSGAFAGVVTQFRVLNKPRLDVYSYALVIEPRLSQLGRRFQNEVFAADTALGVKDLLEGVLSGNASTLSTLTGHGLTLDHTMHASVPTDYQRTNITKYSESDLQFISRTCEHFGVFYYFTFETSGEAVVDKVTFAAVNDAFPVGDSGGLTFTPYKTAASVDKAAVISLERISVPKFQQISLRDYNEETPSVGLLAQSTKGQGMGAVVEYGNHYPTEDEGRKLAAIRAEEDAWQSNVFQGTSTAAWLKAGVAFELKDHPISSFNGEYVVVAASHAAGAPGALADTTVVEARPYRNEFTAIKKSQPFRPKRVTPRPSMGGVFNAVVDSGNASDKRAVIDDAGRYRIKLKFNEGTSNTQDGKSSGPVRQAQPYAGASANGAVSGFHLPLVRSAEVLVAHVNGDPDRPIILGAAYNGTNADPVKSSSSTMNRLRTTAGLLMELDDGTTDTDPTFIRFDVPVSPTADIPSGTYFRLGALVSGDDKVQSKLTTTTSSATASSTDPYSDSGGGLAYQDFKNKTYNSEQSVSVKVTATNTPDGTGLLVYSNSNLDVNIEKYATMQFGQGHATKTVNGDSTHSVANGIWSMSAKMQVKVSAGDSSNPADIVLTASNAIKQTANGPTSFFTYGTTTKYTVGESFTMFFGFEQTIKSAISITIQASGVTTLTLGANTSLTLGVKADMIIGKSMKLCTIGGDMKITTTDMKVTGSDLKICTDDMKICDVDFKLCDMNITVEKLVVKDMKDEFKNVYTEIAMSKVEASKKGLNSKFVDLEILS